MSGTMQVKFLRVLQEKKIRKIGSTEEIVVDVRILAATNTDLEREVHDKMFREDLFYRLNVIPIHMPPLRERREDIPLLASHFLTKACASNRKNVARISEEAMERLKAYDWPGNVREVENVIERAVALESSGVILPDRLPEKVRDFGTRTPAPATASGRDVFPGEGVDFEKNVAAFEKTLLTGAMEKAGGVQTKAARLLNMNLRSFRYLLQKYGLR
jgi:two-component system response regulator PilR (NtrC family)